ncbi:MAG: hypothetical protein ACW97Z_15160 [Candidatus Hodarchaeales archaeon]
MRVNTTETSFANFEWLKDFIRNKPWIVLLIPSYFIVNFLVLSNPYSFSLNNLDAKYSQLGLSLLAFILLTLIGLTSYRYGFRYSWTAIFIVYSITFLGMSLDALNFSIANMDIPFLFFLWRFPMVLYVSGLWINIANFYTDKSYVKYIPALAMTVIGGIWFITSLTFSEDVTLVMNVFLYGIFIPMTIITSYSWYKFSEETSYRSSSLIALGFLLIGLVYSQWTLWDPINLNPLYSIFFTIFNFSLLLILRGFKSISLKDRILS